MVKYIAITPIKDEDNYLPNLISSFQNSTCKPLMWYLVDDGSEDTSKKIIEHFVQQVTWCKLISMGGKTHRKRGRAVVDAIMQAYEDSKSLQYDFLIKVDADITFQKDIVNLLIKRMVENPDFGICGPELIIERNGRIEVDRKLPKEFVRGAFRIYRNECFKSINGLVRKKGWDGIDQIKAKINGWKVERFTDIIACNNREQGNASGKIVSSIENGRGSYYMGSLFLFMLYESGQYSKQKPYFIRGIFMIIGFLIGFILRDRIQDKFVVKYVQNQHKKFLKNKLSL